MIELLDRVEERFSEVERLLASPEVASNPKKLRELAREHKQMTVTVEAARRYRKLVERLDEARSLSESDDKELRELADSELETLEPERAQLEEELKVLLLPKDPNDGRDIVVEIRAGTGGDEAALFAADLYRMYQRLVDSHGWKLEVLSSNPTGQGGFKEVIFSVAGDDAYGTMKYESGVHRVQRVPATEASGRIHTSAASVAVLPEAEEVDVEVADSDLKIDVYRSSGPGGQSVNTTDSAVRITHLPTGLVVTCQDEKSQLKNKQKALRVLRARLLDAAMREQQEKMAAQRKSMVSTGDRSAKIRTYNFPQGRVTDHRIGFTLHQLDRVLEGELDPLIEALRDHDRETRLAAQASVGA